MRKFYLSYKVEELPCSGGQGPFPNFVILGLRREAIHTGSVPSGQGWKGLQKTLPACCVALGWKQGGDGKPDQNDDRLSH